MVLVKINTYPFSFQKGNLLFHIILFICGKIDGTHFSCLFLKRLAPFPSTPKSKNRPHRELGGCGGGGECERDMQSFVLGYASAILSF